MSECGTQILNGTLHSAWPLLSVIPFVTGQGNKEGSRQGSRFTF